MLLQENIYRNFGMPQPNGYRKALRFMKHADKFGFPIITFVDTPGAFAGKNAEDLGQVRGCSGNIKVLGARTQKEGSGAAHYLGWQVGLYNSLAGKTAAGPPSSPRAAACWERSGAWPHDTLEMQACQALQCCSCNDPVFCRASGALVSPACQASAQGP